MSEERKVKRWITRGGKRIPIFEGEGFIPQFKEGLKEGLKKGKEERDKKRLEKQIDDDEDKKEKQISSNKRVAAEMNKKETPKKKQSSSSSKPSGKGVSLGHGKSGGTGTNKLAQGIGQGLTQGSGVLDTLSKQGSAATKRNQKGKDDKDKASKYDELDKKKKGRK